MLLFYYAPDITMFSLVWKCFFVTF